MRLTLNTIDWLLIRALILVVGVQLVCVIWQFISRYFLGTPSTVTEEIAQLLLMWLGFLGLHMCSRGGNIWRSTFWATCPQVRSAEWYR